MTTIRLEQPHDYRQIRHLNEVAFGQPLEANLVEKLRERCREILSLVAADRGEVVGHILFTPVLIENQSEPVVGMGLGRWPCSLNGSGKA